MMQNNNFYPFLRIAAVCSFIGALTTALLLFLPNTATSDFASSLQLHANGLYLSKLWILFIHPQVNLIATLGIGYMLLKKRPVYIIIGTLFLAIWAYTEMSQQALLIDALNQFWRPGYLTSSTEADKQLYKTLITGASGISDSKYFLVIYSFGIGSLLYGLALIRETGLGKWISLSLLFIGCLSLSSFARFYLGVTQINDIVDWLYKWIYTYLQPSVRIAIGIWMIIQLKAMKKEMTSLS